MGILIAIGSFTAGALAMAAYCAAKGKLLNEETTDTTSAIKLSESEFKALDAAAFDDGKTVHDFVMNAVHFPELTVSQLLEWMRVYPGCYLNRYGDLVLDDVTNRRIIVRGCKTMDDFMLQEEVVEDE